MGRWLVSPNGLYKLGIDASLRLLILSVYNDINILWTPELGINAERAGRTLMMSPSGNLELKPAQDEPVIWSTNTSGNPGAVAALCDDCVFKVLDYNNSSIWSKSRLIDS